MAPGETATARVRVRLGLVGFGLALLGLIICGRFFYIQVVLGPQLREEATREYQKTCPVLPVRGMIQDRKGLELAISTRASSAGDDSVGWCSGSRVGQLTNEIGRCWR